MLTIISMLLLLTASVAFARELPVGESVYDMEEPTGATSAPISVYCYRSANWAPGRPIVFVFHGMNRNAGDYRASWEGFADTDGLLIVCPEFTDAKYPGSRYYNTGNIMDKTNGKGNLQPKDEWVFPVVDRVIRDVKTRMGAENSPVAVFGHSAGAQMVRPPLRAVRRPHRSESHHARKRRLVHDAGRERTLPLRLGWRAALR